MKPNPQVLLVDRHSGDVKVVRDTLGSAGLEIHVRTSASAALVAFHALEPDLVLVDFDVPGTTGVAVTREIKNTERGRSTPVILMTEGPIEEAQRTQALTASGCSMLLQKPILPQDLLDTLSRFLPGAFIGDKKEKKPAPKSSAPRRAAGVMRDPGTPFTADSFDDESLGALLDQVFPTADSGNLAHAIRTRPSQRTTSDERTTEAPAASSPAGTAAASTPGASRADGRPAATHIAEPLAAPQNAGRAAARAPHAAAPIESPTMPTPTAATAATAEPSTSELVEEYLAADTSVLSDESLPTGLSVKDDETLDRVFDGVWSRPTVAEDRDIEPLSAPMPAPMTAPPDPSSSFSAAGSARPAPAPEAPSSGGVPAAAAGAPTQGPSDSAASSAAAPSFFDGPLETLDVDEPGSEAGVWQQLDAALPPVPITGPIPHAPEPAAPSTTSPTATTGTHQDSVPVTTYASGPPSPATAASTHAPAPPADVVIVTADALPSSPSSEPATPAPAGTSREPAPVETIPLARETGPTPNAPAVQASESRRAKKNKKEKSRGQDRQEPIALSAQEPAMSLPNAMQPQSVAESLSHTTLSQPISRSMDEALADPTRDEMRSGMKPRRSLAIGVVAAGLALAAVVALFVVVNRSNDSDLRATTPSRARHADTSPSVENTSPETAPPSEEGAAREMPPVIPSAGDDTRQATPPTSASAPGAAASLPHTANAPPNPLPTAQSTRHGQTPATGAGAHPSPPRAGAPGAIASSATPPALPTPSPADSPAAPPVAPPTSGAAEPPPGAPSSGPAPDREPAPVPEAPAPAATGSGSTESGGAPSASPVPDSGASHPSPEPSPAAVGQVALGATMTVPAPAAAEGDEPENLAAEPLASPVPLSRPAPAYPLAALAMRATGTVGILVKVEADGHVSDVKVVRSASPALNAAAVAAARRWTYRSAHRGIESVATWIEETVVFRLK